MRLKIVWQLQALEGVDISTLTVEEEEPESLDAVHDTSIATEVSSNMKKTSNVWQLPEMEVFRKLPDFRFLFFTSGYVKHIKTW